MPNHSTTDTDVFKKTEKPPKPLQILRIRPLLPSSFGAPAHTNRCVNSTGALRGTSKNVCLQPLNGVPVFGFTSMNAHPECESVNAK